MRRQSRQVGVARWMSLEHEHLVKLTIFPLQCWRRTRRRCRNAVGLSLAGAEGVCLACVRVSGRVTRRTVTDARGGGNSGRGGRGRTSAEVTRPRLLVTLLRVAVVVTILLTLTLVLPTRVTAVAAIVFLIFLVVRA